MSLYAELGGYDAILAACRRWHELCLELFDRALADAGLPEQPARRLAAYFRAATIARRAYGESPDHVPDGLAISRAADG